MRDIFFIILFVIILFCLYNQPLESFNNHKHYNDHLFGYRLFGSNYNQPSKSGKLPYAKSSYPIYDMRKCLNENPQGCKTYDALIKPNCKDGYREVYGYSCFPIN